MEVFFIYSIHSSLVSEFWCFLDLTSMGLLLSSWAESWLYPFSSWFSWRDTFCVWLKWPVNVERWSRVCLTVSFSFAPHHVRFKIVFLWSVHMWNRNCFIFFFSKLAHIHRLYISHYCYVPPLPQLHPQLLYFILGRNTTTRSAAAVVSVNLCVGVSLWVSEI